MIGLSLTIDHRVIDGAPGAAFLQTLRQMLRQMVPEFQQPNFAEISPPPTCLIVRSTP